MSVEAGQNLSHYRLIEKLGEGGMGVVWKALDTKLEREVAIKTLPAELANDPERLGRFEREAKAVATLNHPNIVTVYSVEKAEGIQKAVASANDDINQLKDTIKSLRGQLEQMAITHENKMQRLKRSAQDEIQQLKQTIGILRERLEGSHEKQQ